MLEEGFYIKRKNLRDLGFTQPDVEFLPFLAEVNRKVEGEIRREIEMNMSQDTRQKYFELLDKNDFSSEYMQNWLRQNVPDVTSITVDWVNIALFDLRQCHGKIGNITRV